MAEWWWLALAWLVGLLTVPAVTGGLAWFGWATSRTTGYNGCVVCEHGVVAAIGERTNLSLWLRARWHRLFWGRRRWHREAVASHRSRRTVSTEKIILASPDVEGAEG